MSYSEIYNDLIKIEKDCNRAKLFYPNRLQYYGSGLSNVISYDTYCLLPFILCEMAVSLRKLLEKKEENEKRRMKND